MKKNHIYTHRYAGKPKGFSLIEFMVASILSMIVLIAVGAGYFAARKVNDVAIARLNAQQDIRNLSNMVVYDARMAGDFGCFNLSNVDKANGIAIAADHSEKSNIRRLEDFAYSGTVNLSEGVKSIAQNNFAAATGGVSGFTPQSDALVFQYGEGAPPVNTATANSVSIGNDAVTAALGSNAPVAVSTCGTMGIYTGNKNNNNVEKISPDLPGTMTAAEALPELSLTRYIVNMYVVGTHGGRQGLYRIRLGADNNWETPQLLLPNITRMNVLYGYVHGCFGVDPKVASAASGVVETFQFTDRPLSSDPARPLAGIRLVLNGNSLAAEGETMADAASRESAGNVYVYNIDANIRGGNKCANR